MACFKRKWAKVEENFNTWVCRSASCFKVREVGQVEENYVRDVLKLKIVPNPKNPDEINIDPESINYIVTNNFGDQRIALGAWTLAHRFGHVLESGNKKVAAYEYFVNEFWRDIRWFFRSVYDHELEVSQYQSGTYTLNGNANNILKSFFQQIGTMKSAREKTLRNAREFTHELFAQYIITGQVKFNPLPRSIKYWKNPTDTRWYPREKQRGSWSFISNKKTPEEFEEYNEHLQENLAEMTKTNIEYTLHGCVGKIFVM